MQLNNHNIFQNQNLHSFFKIYKRIHFFHILLYERLVLVPSIQEKSCKKHYTASAKNR